MRHLKNLLEEAGFKVREVSETILPFQNLIALIINENLSLFMKKK